MTRLTTKLILLAGLAAMLIAPAVKADDWNQKTVFTFSGPVAIPGQVLPAGTYVFKLLNSSSNRHIVQVFNQDENHVYGTFLAIPDYHMHPPSQPLVKFHERAADEPQAIKAWVYPGKSYGHEFVYPKTKAVELARLNDTPVPALPTNIPPDTLKLDIKITAPEISAMVMAPVVVEEPNGQEEAVETAFAETPMATDSADELPSTASPLPLIAVLGMVSLAAAMTLRIAAPAKTK
jgi:hypothetical protein